MNKLILTIFTLIFVTNTSYAYDPSFTNARKFFVKKKYRHAEVLFMRAYKKETDKRKKAQILRFMAATRYYQGKHKLAKTTFKIAKRYSPSVKMVARDKKLVEFFREEKQKTSFVVSSNATSATILLDGILAGNVGGNIDASAGIKKLIVSAPGYTSRSVRIKIKPNKINRYTVNLKKIQKAPARLVRQKPKRVKIKPLQSRDYYQAQRRVKVVMPKQDFIDRAEQDEFAVEAKKQIEAETARSYNAPAKPAPTYANPAPTYAQPIQRQHTLNQRQHTLNQRQHTLNQRQHRRIHIHMVVEFTLLHHHHRRQWQIPFRFHSTISSLLHTERRHRNRIRL